MCCMYERCCTNKRWLIELFQEVAKHFLTSLAGHYGPMEGQVTRYHLVQLSPTMEGRGLYAVSKHSQDVTFCISPCGSAHTMRLIASPMPQPSVKGALSPVRVLICLWRSSEWWLTIWPCWKERSQGGHNQHVACVVVLLCFKKRQAEPLTLVTIGVKRKKNNVFNFNLSV